MLMAFLTRTNGIVIPLALLCTHLCLCYQVLFPRSKLTQSFLQNLHANPNILSHITPYVVFALGIAAITATLSLGGEGHSAVLFEYTSIKSLIRNTLYYLGIFGDFFAIPNILPQSLKSLKYSFLIPNIVGLGLFLCFIYPIIIGIRIFWHKSPALFLYLFMLGSLCLLILWPALQGLRFTFNVLPFVVFLGALGLENLISKNQNHLKAHIIKALQILSLVIIVYFTFKTTVYIVRNFLHHHSPDSKAWEAYSSDAKDMYDVIKARTKPSDIIVFFKPRALYLNTNRLSITIQNKEALIQRLLHNDYKVNGIQHRITHILSFSEEYALEHSLPQDYLQSLLDLDAISIVYKNNGFTLYYITKPEMILRR